MKNLEFKPSGGGGFFGWLGGWFGVWGVWGGCWWFWWGVLRQRCRA